MPLSLNLLTLPGDLNPYGFLSGSAYVYSYYSTPKSSGGSPAPRPKPEPEPEVQSFAEGEDIGIDYPEAPVWGTYIEPGGVVGAVATAASVISDVVDRPPSTGTRPEDFEEGGVFADEPGGWVLDGEPWDPYATGGSSDPEEEEEPPPVVIPLDASEELDVIEQPIDEEEEEEATVSTFWDIASGVVDVIQGQPVGGPVGFAPPVSPGPTVGAPSMVGGTGATSNLRWNPRTGRWECKRRRRRRLLTESDFNDLMRIATLPSKQNVTVALAKAIGRRS